MQFHPYMNMNLRQDFQAAVLSAFGLILESDIP